MGRRTLLLITSVLLAAVGTAIVAIYVREADSRATQNQATATFVVAARQIRAGVPIEAADVRTQSLRASDQLPTSTQVLADVIGRTTTADILPDVTVDSRLLGEPGATAEAAIRQDELGIDVELQDPNRAVSLLGIGSYVRIFRLTPEGEAEQLARQARVISIGGTVEPSGAAGPDGQNSVGSSAVPAAIVGLSVGQKIATDIIAAQGREQGLYFTVIPSVDVRQDS